MEISKIKVPGINNALDIKDASARTSLGNKVDKISGKGLSTNDYTTDEKNKLSGIESGAQVHKAPTAAEVKSALGTGSGTSKYLREDGNWSTPSNTENITYAALKAKRDNSQLIPGRFYRITDFVTTTTQENTQSAGHPFDVIVRADAVNKLNENAFAALHSGDTYFANSKLEAWELKYCLDNDTSRFEWADTTNGKGIIYYMKDEFDNECSYDFKNVQYVYIPYFVLDDMMLMANETYKRDSTKDVVINSTTYYGYTKTVTSSPFTENVWVTDTVVLNSSTVYTISGGVASAYTDGMGVYIVNVNNRSGVYFTFTDNTSSDVIDASIQNNTLNVYNNKISVQKYSQKIRISFNLFVGTKYYNNILENDCVNNLFGNNCYNNILDNGSSDNTFGNNCYNNTLRFCRSTTLGNYCYDNTLGKNCYGITLGDYCHDNFLFGSDYNITFGKYCTYNTLGKNCYGITLGDSCYSNSFGNECRYNSFGNYFKYNSFGNNCNLINFQKDHICYVIVENGNQYINVTSTQTTSSRNMLQNIKIAQGVNNTTTRKTISHDTVEDTFQTIYQPANSQVISV